MNLGALIDTYGDTRGIVTTVFEASQAFHENGDDISFGDCADNSAHVPLLFAVRRYQ